jgi:prepilin-type N-terminal cleavage/methylation domain-containing protein
MERGAGDCSSDATQDNPDGEPSTPIGSNGFTLLELIVSMMILGMLVGVLYESMHVGLRSVDISRGKADTFQRVRIAREVISRELNSAYLTPSSSNWTVFLGDEFFGKAGNEAGSGTKEEETGFKGEDDTVQGSPSDRLSFSSLPEYPDGSRVLTWNRILLADRGGDDGGSDLMLIRKPLFGPWRTDTLRLTGGIDALDVKYLKTEDNGEPEWVMDWDSDRELPEAIEIDLSWHEGNSADLRVTRLPLLIYIPERPVR